MFEALVEVDRGGCSSKLAIAGGDGASDVGVLGGRGYKKGDSRVPTMKAALDKMITHYNRPDLAELYTALESAMAEKKNIKPNLDYPAGPAYHLMGFDTQTFTPLFVCARITGWTAHIMEQLEANSLIRPLSEYNGPDQRSL